VTATDTAPAKPQRQIAPTPEECDHPHPVRGIMAHEFSPYTGAEGPEGVRRTTMYYGPVIGGLPIRAWHCDVCGLLRLEYADSRREERRLFPGPQPGLLAEVVPEVTAPEAHLGMQARVSGLSLSPELERAIAPPARKPFQLPEITLPSIAQTIDGIVVLGLVATLVGLVALAIGAVYDWTTAGWEGSIAIATGSTFGGAVLLKIGAAAFQHFFPFPQLAPSPAARAGGRPQLDAIAKTVVTILVVLTLGLLLAGTLAIYDWKPPDIERPIVYGLIALFVLATLLTVVGGAVRALRASAVRPTDQA
jgi:hypothetical protein